jgi:hypothetical protein
MKRRTSAELILMAVLLGSAVDYAAEQPRTDSPGTKGGARILHRSDDWEVQVDSAQFATVSAGFPKASIELKGSSPADHGAVVLRCVARRDLDLKVLQRITEIPDIMVAGGARVEMSAFTVTHEKADPEDKGWRVFWTQGTPKILSVQADGVKLAKGESLFVIATFRAPRELVRAAAGQKLSLSLSKVTQTTVDVPFPSIQGSPKAEKP